jgi:hypothetical protein
MSKNKLVLEYTDRYFSKPRKGRIEILESDNLEAIFEKLRVMLGSNIDFNSITHHAPPTEAELMAQWKQAIANDETTDGYHDWYLTTYMQ